MFPTHVGTPFPSLTVTWRPIDKKTQQRVTKTKTFAATAAGMHDAKRFYIKQFNAGNDPHIKRAEGA